MLKQGDPAYGIRYVDGSGLNGRGSQKGRRSPPGPGAGRVNLSHSL